MFDGEDIPIAESIAKFKHGVKTARQCAVSAINTCSGGKGMAVTWKKTITYNNALMWMNYRVALISPELSWVMRPIRVIRPLVAAERANAQGEKPKQRRIRAKTADHLLEQRAGELFSSGGPPAGAAQPAPHAPMEPSGPRTDRGGEMGASPNRTWLVQKALVGMTHGPQSGQDANEYTGGKVLGEGSYAVTTQCDHEQHGVVAVKTLKHKDELDFMRELHILSQMDHRRVVRLLDVHVADRWCLIMSFGGGSPANKLWEISSTHKCLPNWVQSWEQLVEGYSICTAWTSCTRI